MLRERANTDKAIFSVHCHNDLGLAVANAWRPCRAGARQVECTINGIGERAGNAALEEVVMAIKTRPDIFKLDTASTPGNLQGESGWSPSSRAFPVQPNKAIVGANAFSHESGIHQDGVLKNAQTYEIMTPKTSACAQARWSWASIPAHAFREKLKDLGYNLGDNAFEDAFNRFKD